MSDYQSVKYMNNFIQNYEIILNHLKSLNIKYPNFYIIPEGGTNARAVRGCSEILTEKDRDFDVICCAVGTGGTISGLINSSLPHQKIIGFPALKGAFLNEDIRKFAKHSNWELCTDYSFGGYAKVNQELIQFINQFKNDFGIPLDPVYTAKMMFGIDDLVKKGFFSRSTKILAIHTGGLQGISGMNDYLKKNNLELIFKTFHRVAWVNGNYFFTEKVINENPGISVAFTNQDSRLSGASDLLINTDLSFNKEFKNDKSLTATLAGGYFSDRIYALGVTGKGDLVDSEVITVDFILKFNLSKNIGIGFSAKNLTDPTIERKQDIQNVVVDSYKKGRNFSLSMKYSF